MASSEKELEAKLTELGQRLLSPPSAVDQLLLLLDDAELSLANVEQSPSNTMQDALTPSRTALVSKELLKHSDVDVKAAVAACISEITRITAPYASYEDEPMKEIFQLIVSSFEELDDQFSRSYMKRTSILETVAKVRSCVVMLDLDCDALILEMFQHLFKSVRDYHPDNVSQSMETIMVLVLEESEDIPQDLLLCILAQLKKENQKISPVACRLAKKVFETCAAKVRSYLVETVKMLNIKLDDYIEVVGNVYRAVSEAVEPSDGSVVSKDVVDNPDDYIEVVGNVYRAVSEAVEPSDGSAVSKDVVDNPLVSDPSSSDVTVKEEAEKAPKAAISVKEDLTAEETPIEAASDRGVLSAAEIPPDSTISNGNLQKFVEESAAGKDTLKDHSPVKKESSKDHLDDSTVGEESLKDCVEEKKSSNTHVEQMEFAKNHVEDNESSEVQGVEKDSSKAFVDKKEPLMAHVDEKFPSIVHVEEKSSLMNHVEEKEPLMTHVEEKEHSKAHVEEKESSKDLVEEKESSKDLVEEKESSKDCLEDSKIVKVSSKVSNKDSTVGEVSSKDRVEDRSAEGKKPEVPVEDAAEHATVSDTQKETDDHPRPAGESENDAGHLSSPSASGKPADEGQSKKAGQGKKEDNLSKEALQSVDKSSKKSSEAMDATEAKGRSVTTFCRFFEP